MQLSKKKLFTPSEGTSTYILVPLTVLMRMRCDIFAPFFFFSLLLFASWTKVEKNLIEIWKINKTSTNLIYRNDLSLFPLQFIFFFFLHVFACGKQEERNISTTKKRREERAPSLKFSHQTTRDSSHTLPS